MPPKPSNNNNSSGSSSSSKDSNSNNGEEETVTQEDGTPSSEETDKEVDEALTKARAELEALKAARAGGLGSKRKVDQLLEIQEEIDKLKSNTSAPKLKETNSFLDPDGIVTVSKYKAMEVNSHGTAFVRRLLDIKTFARTAVAEGTQYDEEQLRQTIVHSLDLVNTQSFSAGNSMSSGFLEKELRALAGADGAKARVITDAEAFKGFTKNGTVWVIDIFAEEDTTTTKELANALIVLGALVKLLDPKNADITSVLAKRMNPGGELYHYDFEYLKSRVNQTLAERCISARSKIYDESGIVDQSKGVWQRTSEKSFSAFDSEAAARGYFHWLALRQARMAQALPLASAGLVGGGGAGGGLSGNAALGGSKTFCASNILTGIFPTVPNISSHGCGYGNSCKFDHNIPAFKIAGLSVQAQVKGRIDILLKNDKTVLDAVIAQHFKTGFN